MIAVATSSLLLVSQSFSSAGLLHDSALAQSKYGLSLGRIDCVESVANSIRRRLLPRIAHHVAVDRRASSR